MQEELFGNAQSRLPPIGQTQNSRADRLAVLAITYHNMGVEQEFLKRYQDALNSYKKGLDMAEMQLGKNHGITKTLRFDLQAN